MVRLMNPITGEEHEDFISESRLLRYEGHTFNPILIHYTLL